MNKQVTDTLSEQNDKLSEEMTETLSDIETKVKMSTGEVWGRILALFDSVEKVSPSMFGNYCSRPSHYFALLHRQRMRKFSEEQRERLGFLLGHLSVDDMGKSYPIVKQGNIQASYYHEKSFIRHHILQGVDL